MAKRSKSKSKSRNSRAIGLSPRNDREFEIRNAADTLIRAEEIRSNQGLMKEVKGEVQRRAKAAAKAVK